MNTKPLILPLAQRATVVRRLVVLLSILLLIAAAPAGFAHGPDASPPAQQAQDVVQRLEALNAQLQQGTTHAAGGLQGTAAERQQLLAELIESNPGEVVRLAVTGEARKGMPVEVQQYLEERSEIEGELQVLHVDYKDSAKSHYVYLLETAIGERYSLHFATPPRELLTGARIRASGVLLRGVKARDAGEDEGAMALDGGDTGIQVLEAGGSATTTTTTTTTAAALPNTFGEQKTLVILVNFQDQPTSKPWTLDQVRSLVFGTVSNFYLENSYQNTWLNGDVSGWYTIPVSSTNCDQIGIGNYAKQAATAAGVNLSAYTRYVYMFPNTSACPWAGQGSIGGSPSQSWINGYLQLDIVGHEVGHNFGLMHSHAWSCTDGSIIGTGSACSALEYGDGLDLMGWASSSHFNAVQKERLGWLNGGVMPPITTVQTSGTYTLDALEPSGSNPKALKIFKGIDSYGYKTWYYLEYRQAIGFDSILASSLSDMTGSNVLNGVVIHTGYDGNGGNTYYLLDMTPETYQFYMRDPALDVGKSFSDPAAGVTISTSWVNGTSAAVQVTLASSSACTRAQPSVAMSPSQSPAVAAGSVVTYTVSVTDNDSSACGSSTFNLQSAVPSGWSGSLGASALSLSPGSAGSTTLTVTSPVSATGGSYGVGATVTNSAATSYSATGSATYSVATATIATSVSTDKASYALGDTVTVTATASSSGKPVANASVTFTVTKPNGSVVTQTATTGSNGQAVYKMRLNKQKDPSGVYQAKDVASSSGSSATATTSFSAQ